MDEDLVEAIADAFRNQMDYIHTEAPQSHRRFYEPALLDAIAGIAEVINLYEPTYDLRYFYRRAGYPEPYPIHEMR